MPVICGTFDGTAVEWRRVVDPTCEAYRVDFEYSLLGYDLASRRLDMVLRYAPGRGHCRRHRHVASTATLVLEGEQCLTERLPDGATRAIRRRPGDYALAAADALPHDEHGGESGATVLLSMVAGEDGVLFEYFDDRTDRRWTVTIAEYVTAWEQGAVYGAAPDR